MANVLMCSTQLWSYIWSSIDYYSKTDLLELVIVKSEMDPGTEDVGVVKAMLIRCRMNLRIWTENSLLLAQPQQNGSVDSASDSHRYLIPLKVAYV